MLTNLFNATGTKRIRIRGALTGACLLLSALALGAAPLHADDRSADYSGSTRTTFEPVAPGRLPGISEGTFPGFRTSAPALDHESPSDRTPEHGRSRDPDPPVENPVSEAEEIDRRLTFRYSDPVVGRLLRSITTEQAVRLYYEATGLIDSRHLEPSSYEARVGQAFKNLAHAVANREFLAANGIAPGPERIGPFRDSLDELLRTRPVRTSGDALNMLYSTMDLARRQIGLSPAAVALEFVHGATESLDRYSAFEAEDVPRAPSANLDDHVVGIGVEIKPHDRGVLVVRAIRGGPAAEAGLQADDIIDSVDGRDLAGQGMNDAVDLIAGVAGSRVLLGVVRDGRPLGRVSLVRRRVEIPSVSEVRMLEGTKVGYLKLDKFTASSEAEMDKALWSLYEQGMQSLVIDVRGNPGGLLTTAIALSDKFLPSGTIVSTRGRTMQDQMAESARYDRTWKIPLVVLIDENSASASEIFAAAIQENRRGLVVGRQSYGKGTVQTHFPLASVHGNLRLTTARFYSPTGRVMAGAGVTPDVAIDAAAGAAGASAAKSDPFLATAVQIAAAEQVRDLAAAADRRTRYPG